MPIGRIRFGNIFTKLKNMGNKSKSEPQNSKVIEMEAQSDNTSTEMQRFDDSDANQPAIGASQRWFNAVCDGKLDAVRSMLLSGDVNVDVLDENNWSALHLCAWNGYADICQELLDHGCNVKNTSASHISPLALASQKGHVQVANLLIRARCDVNQAASVDLYEAVTPLHFAAQHGHVQVVKLLLQSGAVINVTMSAHGVQGITPLHIAVESGHLDVMDILIEGGCDVQKSTQCSQVEC